MKKEIKETILNELNARTETRNSLGGFGKRSPRSLTYRQHTADGLRQELEIIMQLPRFSDDESIVHLTAQIKLGSESVDGLFEDIMSKTKNYVSSRDKYFVSQNIGLLGPEQKFLSWRAYDIVDVKAKLGELTQYFEHYGLAFFQGHHRLLDVVQSYANQDPRLPRGERFHVYMMCLCVLVGENDCAESIYKSKFEIKPGLKNKYQQAWDALCKHM